MLHASKNFYYADSMDESLWISDNEGDKDDIRMFFIEKVGLYLIFGFLF